MMNLRYLVAALLVGLAFVAAPASADPRVLAGACAYQIQTSGYTECYGVTNGCNDGLVPGGIGHSFHGPNNGGGWCWVSAEVFGSSYVVAICQDLDQAGGRSCLGL